MFADYLNRSVKELQLQTRTVKTVYRTDWHVLNLLLQSDLKRIFVCEWRKEYVLSLGSASLLSNLSDFAFLQEIHMKKVAS